MYLFSAISAICLETHRPLCVGCQYINADYHPLFFQIITFILTCISSSGAVQIAVNLRASADWKVPLITHRKRDIRFKIKINQFRWYPVI